VFLSFILAILVHFGAFVNKSLKFIFVLKWVSMSDTKQESIDLHRQKHGKLEVKSKVPVNNRHDLSLAYTPGVGAVSELVAKDPAEAYNLTLKGNTIAIVSDGSAVLGLGNLGAEGAIPVMEGKAILFKEFAGLDAFPICLDTQDSEEIIRTVKNIAPVFGGINLEDISAPRCFAIEERLRAELAIPVMHDDQHGTATVVLAGLINTLKLRGTKKEEAKIVINGAGAAGTAITKILADYGFKHFTLCDSQGIIFKERGDLNAEKLKLIAYLEAKVGSYVATAGDLRRAMTGQDFFIGVSKGNLVDVEMIKSMNGRPVVFALANPVPEIMPDLAKQAGAFVVATGRSDFPNQINNVLAFPGIFRGALDNRIKQFTDEMFLRAAENLAACVVNLTTEQILPNPFDKNIVAKIAEAVKD
jgi:malate dehydrogenase (oxaloacetate-decarboxylating)